MAALYLLDTDMLIASLKGAAPVRQQLDALPLASLRLSAIVLGELAFGAETSAYGERYRARFDELARRLPLVGVDRDTIRHFAQVRAALERAGTPIGATLVTDNEGEFRRVPGLAVEN